MINPAELRIGNCILDSNGKLINVDYHHIRIAVIYKVLNPEPNYSAIPLTAEILHKCGFKKKGPYGRIGYIDYWDNDGFEIISVDGGGFEVFGSEWTIGKTFYNLHQLQNIYYALFHEELQINL